MKPRAFKPFRHCVSSIAAAITFAAPLAFLLLGTDSAWGVTDTFTTSGTWTCPTGITSISVAVQGGGGAGGAASTTTSSRGGGGGGGACAFNSALTVEPGVTYTVTVGASRAGGTGAGSAGNPSSFSGGVVTPLTLTANGGGGGALNIGSGGAGGTGGTATGGAANRTGGNGHTSGNTTAGGGGGGGAGTNTNGTAASGATGGAGGTGSPAGGAGASQSGAVGAGSAGSAPGGGGSGGYRGTSGTQNGGAGARGQVTIVYTNVKANNEISLNDPASWTGFVPTGALAEWTSVVTAANTTSLGADLTFSGIRISNPGGLVTINSGNTLTLGTAAIDLDLSSATQNLTANCNLAMGAANVWDVASGRTLTLGGNVTGAFAVTKQGAGTATLSGTNDYTGNTTVTGGTLNISGVYTGDPLTSSLLLGTTAAKSVVNVSNDMTLSMITGGSVANSFAVYNQTAGTVTCVGNTNATLTHLANAGGYGYLNLTGGTYRQTANRFSVTNSTGTAGGAGVVYVGGTGTLDLAGTSSMIIGYAAMPASLTVGPGGTVDRSTGTGSFWLTTNPNSHGVLNVAGGDFNSAGSGIRVGNNNSGGQVGFVNLAKGTLTLGINGVNGVNAANGGTLYSNYTGGTMKAANNLTAVVPVTNANLTSVSTVFGPIDNSAAVGNTSQDFAGGLTLDTNGNSVTYGSPLLGATGTGVTQADLGNLSSLTGNSGYIGAPMVRFSVPSGGGVPASGYAIISGGQVTGIVITTPGTYALGEIANVTLTGGGGSIAPFPTTALNTANATDSGLTKINSGTLTLAGANTYTGATLVSGGTLKSSTAGSATTDITVATSAAAGALVASDNGQWINTGDLTLNNNSTLVIDYGSSTPSTSVAPIAVDNFNVGTNLGLKIEGALASSLAISQTYPLVQWTTSGPPNGSAFTTILTHRLAGNFSVTGNTLFLTVTNNGPISWNTGNGTWNTVATNWVDGSLAATAYIDPLDGVLFGDAAGATGNPTITLDSALSPSAVTMKSTSHDYTITGSGGIAGAVALTLDAANTKTLTLATVNTYTGTTAVSSGTLSLTGSLTGGGAITVSGNGVLSESGTGIISGASTLTHSSSGTSTLAGDNTYTGLTSVTGGTLNLTGNRTAASGAISVQVGGALGISNGNFSLGASTFTLGGISGTSTVNHTAGSISFSGGTQMLVGNGAGEGTYNLSGGTLTTAAAAIRGIILGTNIGRTGTFNLSGNGTLIMTGSMLQLGRHDSTVTTGTTGIFNQTGATSSATVGILSMGGGVASNSGATAQLNLSAGTFSADSFTALSLGDSSSSTINISGTADVTLPALPGARGAGSTATITFNGGTLRPAGPSATYLGGASGTSALIKAGGASFNVATGNDITIATPLLTDVVSLGGGLTKSGPASLILGGANTYTGNTVVADGTLELATTGQLKFVLGATTGTNNRITGSGTAALKGSFVIDTSAADALPSGSWTLESVNSLTGAYDPTFSVVGFTNAGSDKWTKANGGKIYTFDETTGILTLAPLGGYSSWAAANATTGTPGDDFDGDGVTNGVEYVLGGDKDTNDAGKLPTIVASGGNMTFTFFRAQGSIDGTTTVEINTSLDLTNWTTTYAVPGGAVANNPGVTVVKGTPTGFDTVTLTLPQAPDTKRFARLKVKP